jgi:superoxide dismutase, Cu-Zn family
MNKLLAATGLALAAAMPATAQDSPTAKAEFVNLSGAKIGTAILTETMKGVLIALEITGLPAGEWVAFHVHETGNCDHQTAHESAGGHFNPTNAEHGFLAAKGLHAGDMPNQHVGADGVLRAQVFNSMVQLDGGEAAIRGRALMAFAVKVVVDGRMDSGEFLQTSHLPEALHGSFSSSEWQV